MTTAALYATACEARRPRTLSFELFPPRQSTRADQTWGQVGRLIDLAPDYISVTYGAAGTQGDSRDTSVKLLSRALAARPDLPVVAHLTATAPSLGDLSMTIRLLMLAGVRNFLALRGDCGETPPLFSHADGLVSLIRRVAADVLPNGVGTGIGGTGYASAANPDDYVSIAVAAYPASSGQARLNEIASLRTKREAGADFAISQVFYEATCYETLLVDLDKAHIDLPVIPGIIPLTSGPRLRRLQSLTGVTVPEHLLACFDEDDPGVRFETSLRHTMHLISDVLARGAPGIHLYTFNRCRPAFDIVYALRALGYFSATGPTPDSDATELVRFALSRLTPTS